MTARATSVDRCDYCGLPLAAPPIPRESPTPPPVAPPAEALYCCYGCRFAAAVTREKGEAGHARLLMIRLGLAIFFTLNVTVFTMALWTTSVYERAPTDTSPLAGALDGLFRYASLLFALPVMLLLGGPLVESALSDLRRRVASTDPLLLSGVAASFLYSVISVVRGEGHVYFEVGCVVLLAVTLGRWLEATGKLKTTAALRALSSLLPDHVRRIVGEREEEVSATSIVPGDVVRVLPGERIPVDGQIVKNLAAIDEQIVTGESQPAIKELGDRVFAGTLNLDGDLSIRATSAAGEGAIDRLVASIVAAASQKERYGRLADRVATIFLPLVAILAIGAFAYHSRQRGLDEGLMAGLAVVLIACPCALGLATPMAVWAALGRAARDGIVLRHCDALSQLAAVRSLFFDKTGTLTTGTPRIAHFEADDATPRDDVLAAAAALAASSNHPLAGAVTRFAEPHSAAWPLSAPRTIAGRGLTAEATNGGRVCLGNPQFMLEEGLALTSGLRAAVERGQAAGQSLVCVGWDRRLRGVFLANEELRGNVAQVIDWLKRQKIRVRVLTGDQRRRGEQLADLLGVDVLAELLPEEKLAAIRAARQSHGPVAMVGDGINDAPALAGADVGIALGCGADISRHSADVCLLSDDLSRLPLAIELARQTVRTIRWNLAWAFAYNTIGIGLAIGGWLNPILAAAAMVASSLLVVTGSLRLSNFELAGGPDA